ncbi:MAG TPA: hypothetical protein VFT15_13525, partial [Chitinophagaceae bacterium]|nr:hypothetical protein [Chitinophagaceae bacterium]
MSIQSTDKSPESKYIIMELMAGVILSIVYLKVILSVNDDFWGRDYFTGIFRFYIGLSLIFFFAVLIIGIIGAIRSKQSQKIVGGIFYSIIFWILASVITVFAVNILQVFALYLLLLGITFGFN